VGTRQRFAVPDGWVARGFRFEVEATSSMQRSRIAQHFGARRFAYNWALAQVKANLDARKADPAVAPLAWDFYQLRKAWNQAKEEVAPWWRCASKEAYACGIADLVVALCNWQTPRRAAATASGRVCGSDSPGSRHGAVIAAGCGSPRVRCGWSLIAATSCCR
jgi:putative transposase